MKNTRTISLMIHELLFIQSLILGNTLLARSPSARTIRAGRARRKRVRKYHRKRVPPRITVIGEVGADDDCVQIRSPGKEHAQQEKAQGEAERT